MLNPDHLIRVMPTEGSDSNVKLFQRRCFIFRSSDVLILAVNQTDSALKPSPL